MRNGAYLCRSRLQREGVDRLTVKRLAGAQDAARPVGMVDAVGIVLRFQTERAAVAVDLSALAGAPGAGVAVTSGLGSGVLFSASALAASINVKISASASARVRFNVRFMLFLPPVQPLLFLFWN